MGRELRDALLQLVRHKFAGYPHVMLMAEDIVHDAYVRLRSSKSYAPEKENYGYLSMVCIRLAYRQYMAHATGPLQAYPGAEGTSLLDETDIAEEIIRTENAAAVLESLRILRDIERIVIMQRYYDDFSFSQIAEANGLKLNTVLSHHRRALGKLRPQLTHLIGYRKEHSYEQNTMGTGPHR